MKTLHGGMGCLDETTVFGVSEALANGRCGAKMAANFEEKPAKCGPITAL